MLQNGKTIELVMTVSESDLASTYARSDSERYPKVLSSPAVLGIMERACAQLMIAELQPGEMSVGARFDFSHLAPTPLGELLTARAEFSGRDGALYWFVISAWDAEGCVAKGRHGRAIIRQDEIEARAAARRK